MSCSRTSVELTHLENTQKERCEQYDHCKVTPIPRAASRYDLAHQLVIRACLNFFRPGWNGWNGTRLLVVVRSISSCLCPF